MGMTTGYSRMSRPVVVRTPRMGEPRPRTKGPGGERLIVQVSNLVSIGGVVCTYRFRVEVGSDGG